MIKIVYALLLAAAHCVFLAQPAVANTADQAALDAALADETERLTRRDVEGLVPRTMPDGSRVIDLEGRFQQVAIARKGDDGEIVVGCVGTLDEAQRFFGRDLRSGKALPAWVSGPAPDNLATRAARNGKTPMQQRFYESLIDQGAVQRSRAATITILNADGAGEGFNDATAAAPEGGNSGTTRGQQRLNVFNQAAAIWGAFIDSAVPTVVNSKFDPLACSVSGAILGRAGPTGVQAVTGGFAGTGTVFPIALTNKLFGSDTNGADAEINATFNSAIDNACLGPGTRFYYGLDNATPTGRANLLVVVLHELAHGLGSLSLTGQNGAFAFGTPDIWARYQFDRSTNLLWTQMTDAQRAASSINPNNVLWDGPNVRIASSFLTSARDANGRVELFTPNPFSIGGSVSHWNSTATPNLLMEPTINVGLPLDLDLTRQKMRDIGWFRDSDNNGTEDTITNVLPSGSTVNVGASSFITWTNNGGFNRNVAVELSLDGGATYTALASNVTNTGALLFVPPNTATTQGRIRVRERDFVAPVGVSALNFAINTSPIITPAPAVTRQRGSAAGSAVPVATVADATTLAGALTVTEFIGGTASGITVANITNAGGAVTATLAASCTASAGTVRFRVSDGSLNAFGNLQVNVDTNSPPTLTYGAQSGANGSAVTVNPATGPIDNGTIASTTLVSQGTYTGTITVGATNGVVSLSNLAPSGVHLITVRATDNCGATVVANLQLTVTAPANTAPTFTPAAAITRQQGSPAPASVIVGTVADSQTPAGSLGVLQIEGGSATGIGVTGIANNNGTITASVVATCAATSGTVRFQVNDDTLGSTGDLQVNVLPNAPPTLTYAPQSVAPGGTLAASPATGPLDNGTVTATTLFSPGTYTGTVAVGGTNGVVSLSNAAPIGLHTITVRAIDNCGATTDAPVAIQVNGDAVFRNGFEPVGEITTE